MHLTRTIPHLGCTKFSRLHAHHHPSSSALASSGSAAIIHSPTQANRTLCTPTFLSFSLYISLYLSLYIYMYMYIYTHRAPRARARGATGVSVLGRTSGAEGHHHRAAPIQPRSIDGGGDDDGERERGGRRKGCGPPHLAAGARY